MSPPRLQDLSPADVAGEVVRLVHAQAVRLLFPIAPRVDLGDTPTGIATSLGLSTALLTEWAQRGTNSEQWDAGTALDGVQSVCEALYSCAGEAGEFGTGPLDDSVHDSDPEGVVGVLLRAAWARIQLSQGQGVRPVDLAALAGVTRAYVSEESGLGKLRTKDRLITRETAVRWLEARGVLGIGRR